MRPQPLLFLLGGSSTSFDLVAEMFVPAAGGDQATIALLLADTSGWETYLPTYTQPWTRRGAGYHVIVPDETSRLDLETVTAKLGEATGIFIGGGPTPVYHRLFATEPLRSLIRARYQAGTPVAGFSAGALIAPEICSIPPQDTGEPTGIIARGLGLVTDLIVGVHFSEWNGLPHLLEAMAQTQTATAFGIDEAACVVLANGQVKQVLGGAVHEVKMSDFKRKTYTLKELEPKP